MLKEVLKLVRLISYKAYGFLIFIFGVFVFLAWGGYPYIELVEVSTFVGTVNTVVNFIPWIPEWLHGLRYVISALFALLIICLVLKHIYRENALLIKHYSFAKQLVGHNKRVFEPYKLTTVEIDLFGMLENIPSAFRYQDKELGNALRQPFLHYFYYGIAHTPFVFRAGFQFGDECNIRILHKRRKNESVFVELSKHDDENLFLVRSESNPVEKTSDELLLVISTSLRINDEEMSCLNPTSKHILKFELATKSFDNISSYAQMERYRNEILYHMREKCKDKGINTVHLVASTSVAFSFFIGQGLSETHDPEIIVYHYENNTYPWGLRIKSSDETALVSTNER